ncbi:SpoIIE family protein phosphatase [Nonomuraea phyllanthi]|uniref:SpoIIE family protein phosphatase n=1 Tax=Nonomuraea phyllanthi TaxID=2219224 RepID=A0A5C4VZZ7_9ACTN|nr:SpoIIE family protein phosphatase [Nonomuraea phyllanthi]KAB8190910.1 SpoIIE family protein phosphatase [Nonomuraea phyllanthi]
MGEQRAEGPRDKGTARSSEERERLLTLVGEDLWGIELLRFATQQAVAELNGLGGMAHLGSPGRGGGLRLAVATGLPPAYAHAWDRLDGDDLLAPARAFHEGTFVRAPLPETDGTGTGGSQSWPVGRAMVAVPLLTPGGPIGALSVVTASSREPPPRRRAFLETLGRWAGERLNKASEPPDAMHATPQEQPTSARMGQDLQAVGTWDWNIGTGDVVWNDAMFAVFGIDPDDFDGRIETWTGLVHPDDLPWVLADLDQAVRAGRMYSTEYRVCRPDGALRWVRARGRVLPEKYGGPTRMIGTMWDVSRTHEVLETVTAPPATPAERAAVERAEAERTRRVRELTQALAEAVSVQDVVDASNHHVLPAFGAAGLMLSYMEGDHLRPVGHAGYSKDFINRITPLPTTGNYAIAEVLHDRTPLFINSAEEYMERYPTTADLPAAGGKGAWAFLPLIASGRLVGACVVSFAEPHLFSGEERNLLTALSGLIAQAMERARLYDREHTRSQELQRGLLPHVLPVLPAVTTAARYVPAAQDMEVGGDWYDVIPMSADRVALVVGDVMGHGVDEAVTMARLRTAVRTLTDLELSPDDLLSHLNGLVSDLGDDFYATCLYLVYDATTRSCTLTRAGHPPPAVVLPDGTVYFPDIGPNSPLGAATPPFDTLTMELPEGSLLVLYTDGLVESSTFDIDQGMTILAEALQGAKSGALPGTPCPHQGEDAAGSHCTECLQALCDSLTTLPPLRQGPTDDAAVLIAHTHALPSEDMASWELPEHPKAAGEARDHVRAQLDAWGLDDLSMTTELLASELVTNVIRHAKGPIWLRLLRSDVLTCEVSDGSLTTPRIRRATETDEGGRGLQLVASIAHRWGTRYTDTGKCIWTEQPLTPPSFDAMTQSDLMLRV